MEIQSSLPDQNFTMLGHSSLTRATDRPVILKQHSTQASEETSHTCSKTLFKF
jgi:hypothetical protein